MKVINKARAGGKTIQLLYLSDFHQWPIICFNEDNCKSLLVESARLGLNIPRPISISNMMKSEIKGYDGYLMDESIACIQQLFDNILGKNKLKAITMTEPFINRTWDGREVKDEF